MRLTAFSIALALLVVSAHAQEPHGDHDLAHEFVAGDLEIAHPWARAQVRGEATLVFMEIVNSGVADMLTGATAAVAADARIVGITLAGDAVTLQDVVEIAVPAGDFDLDPGGLAIALDGLTSDLVEGGHFDLTLTFAKAGVVEIEVLVEAANANQHSHAGHNH